MQSVALSLRVLDLNRQPHDQGTAKTDGFVNELDGAELNVANPRMQISMHQIRAQGK